MLLLGNLMPHHAHGPRARHHGPLLLGWPLRCKTRLTLSKTDPRRFDAVKGEIPGSLILVGCLVTVSGLDSRKALQAYA